MIRSKMQFFLLRDPNLLSSTLTYCCKYACCHLSIETEQLISTPFDFFIDRKKGSMLEIIWPILLCFNILDYKVEVCVSLHSLENRYALIFCPLHKTKEGIDG